MKGCPTCGRLYPDEAGFCPVDGVSLTSATNAPVASDVEDSRLGQLVGDRYELRRVVADGAMGRVYEALDRLERRNVAVKILHSEVAADEVSVQRFRREFQVSQLLPVEHVVKVIDFAPTHDGSYALVMEFLYGEELSAALRRRGRLPAVRVVRMLSQMALALDRAHAKKLVHRDLKPDNVFLCQTSEGDDVKILDFGSVKDKARSAKNLTMMGTTIGSPFYMAPEQAQGLPSLDHRADIWALACIGFECLTGRVPFNGSSGPSILVSILQHDAPRLTAVAREVGIAIPKSIDAVFGRGFSKKPEFRPSTAGEFVDEFGVALGLRGTHAKWAATPEQELQQRIEDAPVVLSEGRERRDGGTAVGEADPDAPKSIGEAPSRARAAARFSPDSRESASVFASEDDDGSDSLLIPTTRAFPGGLLGAGGCVAVLIVVVLWLVL